MVSTIVGGAKGEPLLKFVKRRVQEVQECRKDPAPVETRTETKEKDSSKSWPVILLVFRRASHVAEDV